MLRFIPCASVLSLSVVVLSALPAHAGGAFGPKANNAQPVQPPPPAFARNYSPDAPRTATAPAAVPQQAIVLPLAAGQQPARREVAGILTVAEARPADYRAVARPVRPLSFAPADPNAVISKLPSGRVVMSPAPGAYVASPGEVAYYRRLANPYAPPSFQMVGSTAGRHMDAPVALTYGVQPGRRFNPGPKVIWLDRRNGYAQPADNAHVRHMK